MKDRLVTYHGSMTDYHGRVYKVAQTPEDPSERGYVLHDPNGVKLGDSSTFLWNVHPRSFTDVEEA